MTQYNCINMFTHEVMATFNTLEAAENFIDAAADYPDWWTVPPMDIVMTDDDVTR